MNKINPLFILIFAIVFFVISLISLSSVKNTLVDAKQQDKQYLVLANEYNSLQNAWGKETRTKQRIEKILKLSNINNARISLNGKIIKINIKNTKIKFLDKFMNKVLNETITINKIILNKNSLYIEAVR